MCSPINCLHAFYLSRRSRLSKHSCTIASLNLCRICTMEYLNIHSRMSGQPCTLKDILGFFSESGFSLPQNDMQLLQGTVRRVVRVWECDFDAVPRSNSRGRQECDFWPRGWNAPYSNAVYAWPSNQPIPCGFFISTRRNTSPHGIVHRENRESQ